MLQRVGDVRILSKTERRWVFSERNPDYLALCGLIHVKHLAVVYAVFQCLIVTAVIVNTFIEVEKTIWKFVLAFFWIVAVGSGGFLIAGSLRLRSAYLLPYMAVNFLFVAGVVMRLFIDFLDSANTKDTLEPRKLVVFFVESFFIVFSVYSMIVAWHLFIYIVDWKMAVEIKKAERRSYEERLENWKEPPFLVAYPYGLSF